MCCQATCLEGVSGPARIQVGVSATAECQSCIRCNVLVFFLLSPTYIVLAHVAHPLL
jgi:hypothetical protein